MKDFLDDGNLVPGIHSYTAQNFETQFVKGFASSITRKEIFNDFKKWMEKLNQIEPPQFIWLDGSYLTQKINPNDLDLVVFYRPESINSKEKAEDIKKLVNVTSRQYNCDAYLCLDVGHLDGNIVNAYFREHSLMEKYWMGQFTFDRLRRPKGLVELNKEEVMNFMGGV